MDNQDRYKNRFGLDGSDKNKAKCAFEHAVDIRKFEIELYWKRATYFWALIAVAFAGFFAILSTEKIQEKELYAYFVAVIGFVFTWAWFLVNRGSKFWQENWENHVGMLEDSVIGPLYKTVLHRPSSSTYIDKFITGPAKVSVSKINQWVSTFTLLIWISLIFQVLPKFSLSAPPSWERICVAIVGLISCFMMCYGGKSNLGPHKHKMRTRKAQIL
ncbi:MAG: hypothetical protein KKD63_16755 [Proteobacteria bacterium]|nr:hypothetical protein [Desulfobulbaceae bacterium]MBU4154523.1 hypothetical protein [Pseudomonadota bacterium]